MAASRYAIGGPEFLDQTAGRLRQRRRGRPQDVDLALPRLAVDAPRISAVVAAHYQLEPVDLNAHGHHSGEAKLVALELACRLTGWTQRAIGEYYGGISSAAVSVARRKVRRGPAALAKAVERLSKRLTEGREGAKVDN